MPSTDTPWFIAAALSLWLVMVIGYTPATTADARFVATGDGAVADADSGLVWRMGPDRSTSWDEARRWVRRLSEADPRWRMPSPAEVRSLHDVGDGVTLLAPVFANSGQWAWAQDADGAADRWLFSFTYGGEGWHGRPPPGGGRVFAVRSPPP